MTHQVKIIDTILRVSEEETVTILKSELDFLHDVVRIARSASGDLIDYAYADMLKTEHLACGLSDLLGIGDAAGAYADEKKLGSDPSVFWFTEGDKLWGEIAADRANGIITTPDGRKMKASPRTISKAEWEFMNAPTGGRKH